MDSFVAWLSTTAFGIGPISASRAELIGSVLGVWMVMCNIRVNPLAWPLAIASSALYLLVFSQARLYGDAGLQVLFIVVALWGWWQWLRGHQADGSALKVRYLSKRGQLAALAAFGVLCPATGLFLRHATDTDVPWWDAFPTAGSVIGQWLLGRKYVENWPAWIAVNVVGVALFAYKGLWLTVGLYGLFLVMAAGGWVAWHRLAAANLARPH